MACECLSDCPALGPAVPWGGNARGWKWMGRPVPQTNDVMARSGKRSDMQMVSITNKLYAAVAAMAGWLSRAAPRCPALPRAAPPVLPGHVPSDVHRQDKHTPPNPSRDAKDAAVNPTKKST